MRSVRFSLLATMAWGCSSPGVDCTVTSPSPHARIDGITATDLVLEARGVPGDDASVTWRDDTETLLATATVSADGIARAAAPAQPTPGARTWSAQVRDADGRTVCSVSREVLVGPAPTITIVDPVEGATWRQRAAMTLFARTDAGVPTLRWSSDAHGLLGTALVESDGSATLHTALPPGRHTLTALAEDPLWGTLRAQTRVIVDGEPTPPSILLQPERPRSFEPLRAVVAHASVDREGPVDPGAWSWWRDGAPVPAVVGPDVPAGITRRGEVWTARLTVHDTLGQSAHDEVTTEIGNAPPEVTSVTISPEEPTAASGARCDVVASDRDDDAVTTSVVWTLDGVPVGSTASLDGTLLRRAAGLSCTVVAHDGSLQSPPARAQVVVGNAVPVVTRVDIEPVHPRVADPLTCAADADDADADVVQYQHTWTVDGVEVAQGPSLPAGTARSGQRVACHVRASDGSAWSAQVTATSRIRNTPPELATVRVTPQRPVPFEPITCSAEGARDADDDPISTRFVWTVDGVPMTTGPVLHQGAAGGQAVQCGAVVDDGASTSRTRRDTVHVVSLGPPGNLLVLIADDLGVEKVGAYGNPLGAAAHTPHIDALARDGMRFDRAWANPSCSPTRASLMTGLLPAEHGVGSAIDLSSIEPGLPLDAVTLPEALDAWSPVSYASTMVGKWHLSSLPTTGGLDPLLQGFDHHRGVLGNLRAAAALDGAPQSYFDFETWVDGTAHRSVGYLTSQEADDAVSAINSLPEPWIIVVGFHAPHGPFEAPPAHLLPEGHGLPPAPNQRQLYTAMITALDTEIGRVLHEVPDRTTVVFLGDNGTPGRVAAGADDPSRMKSTPYEGGVRVPLIVRSPVIAHPGTTSDALVHVTDLFPTLVTLAGGRLPDDHRVDGVDLTGLLVDPDRPPPRDIVHTAWFDASTVDPDVRVAARDDRHKVLFTTSDGWSLYDLGHDLREASAPLVPPYAGGAAQAWASLRPAVEALIPSP